MATLDTKQTIMALGRRMVQDRGYNSLSLRDLAKEVGIKTASIYYYFPSKGELGAALAREYTDEFLAYLNGLRADSQNWKSCISSYVDVFRATLLRENRMCLGGILAAERPDLTPEVRTEVERFTELLVQWLTVVLSIGKPEMEGKAARQWAFAVFAAVEGAQLVARGCDSVAVFDNTVEAYRTTGLLP